MLARTARGTAEVRALTAARAAARSDAAPGTAPPGTAPPAVPGPVRTAAALLRTVRGARSALDAAVYAALVTGGRVRARRGSVWERDESSRR
ncbi:hypothetical protein [Cellulomonas sp. Y8]|uniref:hypothetical protein n=1 Tax=Cellulomonas sp. Y8 TaxID=2591145 RepID=UPI0011CA447C|nr:hypothetical protein [Cellulomonas sp. Y8]